jgi:hypothetical protein
MIGGKRGQRHVLPPPRHQRTGAENVHPTIAAITQQGDVRLDAMDPLEPMEIRDQVNVPNGYTAVDQLALCLERWHEMAVAAQPREVFRMAVSGANAFTKM